MSKGRDSASAARSEKESLSEARARVGLFGFSLFEDEFLVIRVPEHAPATKGPSPVAADRMAQLTPAERRVAERLYEGRSYVLIARELGKSPRTVAVQAASIFRKLQVSSRSELVVELASSASAPKAPRPGAHRRLDESASQL